MNPLNTQPGGRELRGNFVLLRADTLRILLPQSEVGNAEYLDAVPQASEVPGIFEYRGARGSEGAQALLALSAAMLPMQAYPQDRFVVTPIATPQGAVGFGWNEVSVLIDARLQAQTLPAAMLADDAPLREFVEIDDKVVFCCDAARLADYVHALEPCRR